MADERYMKGGPQLLFASAHVLAFGVASWLLSGGIVVVWRGLGVALVLGDEVRRIALMVCGAVLVLRMKLSTGHLRWRPYGWRDALSSVAVAAAYQIGFAWAGATAGPLGGWEDVAGALLFLLGGGLTTGVELARSRSFEASSRRSALCTFGPFAVVRHPNLVGDILWGAGWALLTRNKWALALPVLAALGHGAVSAAAEERYLEGQNGQLYRTWARRTKRLIPFVY